MTHSGGFGGAGGDGYAGGGLCAGGAIFVQRGGALSYGAGVESGGSVTGGDGGVYTVNFDSLIAQGGEQTGTAEAGSAFGSGIFLQGNEQIALDPGAGQTLTFDDVIADQAGSGGTGSNAGAGSLLIDGAGTVVLAADDTFSGGITLVSGELVLATPAAAGSGPILVGDGATLRIGANDFTFDVGSEADLNNVVQQIDLTGSLSAPATDYTISFSNSFTLTSEPYAVNLASGDMLTIQGNGYTLDGGGVQRGFFVYAGTVAIDNLAIDHALAAGGAGGSGDIGGGAGLCWVAGCSSPPRAK